jgi:predicted  nucleic acid-binding Zn-ribbon protein
VAELEALFHLQTIDSEIDQKSARIEVIRAALGPTDEVRSARKALEDTRARLHALEARQRQLEYDVEDRSGKIKELETKLYSGTVRVPKELSGLQTEVEHLKTSLGAVEDQTIGVIGQTDEARATAAAQERELAAVEERWKASQAGLRAEGSQLTAAVKALAPRRQAAAADVSPAMMVRYDELRRIRHGVAVARIDRNMCLGCRTTLSTSEVQKARQGQVAYCSSCRRILYAGH